jgi:hypothetical protein
MDLNHASKRGRSSTIDALAVVPAVLVLSAELFTPAEKSGKEMGRDDGGKGRGRKDSGHASAGASGWRRWEGGLRWDRKRELEKEKEGVMKCTIRKWDRSVNLVQLKGSTSTPSEHETPRSLETPLALVPISARLRKSATA